jgi:predicted O-methyltransferase YrrM
MKQKELLAHLLETMLDDGFVGVEIGVDTAETTVCILEQCSKLGHLYAVDPYFKRNGRCKQTEELLGKYDKCTFLRMTSDEAVSHIPDNLDFIFVDGDHSYLAVQSDLTNYVPKIKSDGLLTGHDWTSVRSDFGVVQAAEEYLNEHANLFKPLFTNEQLKDLDLASFKRGGWSESTKRHLIHKKRPSAFPLWWVIKA